MAHWIVNGKQLTDKEYEEHQRQQLEEQERIRLRAETLVQKLGQTYDELTRLLEQNPEVGRQVTERTAKDEEVYRRLKDRLEMADAAPRCRWVKQGGTTCGSPQMKRYIYCFAHRQMAEARALALRLPALEDANAIQIALMRVQQALIEDTITTKKAGLLLYSLQLALTNVSRTTFGQAKDEELVRETVDEEEALQNPLTTEGTEDMEEIRRSGHRVIGTSENQGLPRMNGTPGQVNSDGTDLGRILPKAEQDRFWGELPMAAIQTEKVSGSFDAPSFRAGTRACSG